MAKFDYHWRKSINITAWVLQIVVCVILLAASAWVLAFLSSYADDYDLGSYSGLVNGAAGIQIAITSLTIIFDIAEIVLIAKDRMPPALYLSSACVKTGIWGVIFILDLVSLSVLAIILTLILLYALLPPVHYPFSPPTLTLPPLPPPPTAHIHT
ncbi:hypothetical protein F4778DRAFT_726337 [Xylariomycetidae sp. FL2044]|nr:hypothetical protein F4778DRAFT_726337 [Xylariomycetidae sp. FL2044]